MPTTPAFPFIRPPSGGARTTHLKDTSHSKQVNEQAPFFILDWIEELGVKEQRDWSQTNRAFDRPPATATKVVGKRPLHCTDHSQDQNHPNRPECPQSNFEGTPIAVLPKSKKSEDKPVAKPPLYFQKTPSQESLKFASVSEAIGKANAWNNEGVEMARKEKWLEALLLWKKTLKVRKFAQGTDHPDVSHALNNIGIALGKLNRIDEAMHTLNEALRLRMELYGILHLDTAATLHNMGNVLKQCKKFGQALACYRGAKEIKCAVLGPDHPTLALAISAIGHVYYDRKKYEGALKRYQEALKVCQAAGLQDTHPIVSETLRDIADIRSKQPRRSLVYEAPSCGMHKLLVNPLVGCKVHIIPPS